MYRVFYRADTYTTWTFYNYYASEDEALGAVEVLENQGYEAFIG